MKVYCLFEQSGTFKRAFLNRGISALDFDIQNVFGETDRELDLFAEIKTCYYGKGPSIFDELQPDDLVLAFFPCTYFSNNNELLFTAQHNVFDKLTSIQRNDYVMRRNIDRAKFYNTLLQLFTIAEVYKFRLIVENPYHCSYLENNFPYKPAFIDKNRRQHGDYYSKPTAYWFVNCAPRSYMRNIVPLSTSTIQDHSDIVARSLISPDYAQNFVDCVIFGDNYCDIFNTSNQSLYVPFTDND